MKDIINRIAELRKNIETAKTTDVIEISVELIRIESLLKQLTLNIVSQQSEPLCDHDFKSNGQGADVCVKCGLPYAINC